MWDIELPASGKVTFDFLYLRHLRGDRSAPRSTLPVTHNRSIYPGPDGTLWISLVRGSEGGGGREGAGERGQDLGRGAPPGWPPPGGGPPPDLTAGSGGVEAPQPLLLLLLLPLLRR